MIVKFILPTQPAGSAGGLTFYKNGQQLAARARAKPCITHTNQRVYAGNLVSRLSVFWETPLTNADRIGWGLYAYNTPLTDAYGNPRYIRGYAQYIRANRPRLQFGCNRVDTPPTTFGLPTYYYPQPAFTIADPLKLVINFSSSDTWATQTGAFMFIWASGPSPVGRITPAESYSPVGFVAGNSTTPPLTPTIFALPRAVASRSQQIWVRTSVSLADGRLSGL